jgi:hypothetical protein
MSFMDLEIPEYAYMFGFLQMDGHLARDTGRKGRLTVEISARDESVLHQFQRLTPYPSSLTTRTRTTNFSSAHTSTIWTLCALEARERLAALGLPYGRKSAIVRPPRVPFARRDYVRGLIDADGSVGHTAEGLPFISLATASTAIATYLCFYVRQTTGTERRTRRNARDGVYNVAYMRETAVELARHLYYPDALALERKHASAQRIAAWVRPDGIAKRPPSRRWRPHEDRALLEIGDPATAAHRLGRSTASCGMRLWRLRNGHA